MTAARKRKRTTALDKAHDRADYWQEQAGRARRAVAMIALMLSEEQLIAISDASTFTVWARQASKTRDEEDAGLWQKLPVAGFTELEHP